MSPRLAIILFLATALPASSQTPVIRDEIIVTASAAAEPLDTAPAAVTVVTAAEIEQRAARDLADVLREVPGLTLMRGGSPGKVVSLFTRGGGSKDTLVLWNGVELNNPFFAGFDWARISTAGIERVEVVRGPYSALYGSDAVSGVVNIITSSSGAPRFDADLQAGENGLLNGRVSGHFTSGSLGVSAALEQRSDDGFADNDAFDQTTAIAEARWSLSRGSVGIRARINDYGYGIPRSVNPSGTAFVASPARREDGEELDLALPISLTLGRTEWEVVFSRNDRTDRFEDPEDPFGRFWAVTDVVSDRASALARFRTGSHLLVGGAEEERASVDDSSSYGTSLDSRERRSRGLFVEDRWSRASSRGDLELTVGVRYDDFDTFGTAVSPRAAVAWIRGANKWRAGFGEAFRAPAVGELYIPFFGNSELQPEVSRSAELGYDRRLISARLSVTAFRTDFDELIVYDNIANRFENTGAGRSHGVELGWEHQISAEWTLNASYTWLDTEDRDSGEPFLRRPEHSGSLFIRWSDGRWSASGAAIHAGDRADLTDLFPFGRVMSEAYTTLDLMVERSLGIVTPYLKVENATDEKYEEIFGYPSARRRAIAGVRLRL